MYSTQRITENEHESEFHAQHANEDHTTPSSLAGSYRFIKEIGHGSQGRIYLAKRLSDDQNVVIKQLNIDSIKTWKEYTLFKREGDVLSTLQIDGVARFYEYKECLEDRPPCAYIVQEYIQGETIQTMLNRSHRFEIHEVYDIILQLLNILDQLQKHDPPIIHRDIKPSNVMLEPKVGGYKAYLIDFGAVANPQLQGGGSTVAGTYGYMAPEQLMGTPSPASDIYSLGALIVYLLSGVSPADMQTKDFRLMFEPELQFLEPSVVQILRQMLEPDTKKRLADIQKLKDAFYSFSIGRFDLNSGKSAPKQAGSYDDNYIKRLRAVSGYGDPGNIELWSELPDELPRQIPSGYDDTTPDRIVNGGYTSRLRNYQQPAGVSSLFTNSSINILKFLGAFIVHPVQFATMLFFTLITATFPFTLPIYILIIKSDSESVVNSNVLDRLFLIRIILYITTLIVFELKQIIAVLPFWICLLLLSLGTYIYVKMNNISRSLFDQDYFNSISTGKVPAEQIQSVQESIEQIKSRTQLEYKIFAPRAEDLISKGRKTVARIVSIEYLNGDNDLTTTATQEDYFKHPDRCMNPVYHGLPTFRVSYIFNPPDDARSEDIKHHFDMHIEPEGHLKVGDPLPILYYIDTQSRMERVTSMPFPIVLDDYVSIAEIIDSSSASLPNPDKSK